MRLQRHHRVGGNGAFFRLVVGTNSLRGYYLTNFAMKQHHHWDITEVENMIPFERDIYVNLLTRFVEDENERIKEMNNRR